MLKRACVAAVSHGNYHSIYMYTHNFHIKWIFTVALVTRVSQGYKGVRMQINIYVNIYIYALKFVKLNETYL